MQTENSIPVRSEPIEHHLGSLDDFVERKISVAEIEGRRVGILRKDDAVYAFADWCPHHGGPMCQGQVSGTMLPSEPDEYHFGMDGLIVKCPWHAYEFNVLTGESMGNIMRTRLMVYHTEVRGNQVYIRLKRAASPTATT